MDELTDNPFQLTARVLIELSNRCNYAAQHKRCPLHQMRGDDPVILPAKMVRYVLDTLGHWAFAGDIGFQIYSEPTNDPRLFTFIEHARRACPDCRVIVTTNASYLDQVMVDEMAEAGVGKVYASAYGKAEKVRLQRLHSDKLEYKIWWRRQLDDRLTLYDREPRTPKRPECGAPLTEINITHLARVGLCCKDWKRKHVFGNLYKEKLEDVLVKPPMLETYRRLSRGDRFLPICQQCGASLWWES